MIEISKDIINLEEDDTVAEIIRFLPKNTDDNVIPFFDKMFQNLCVFGNSDFYNNAVLNLTHFYTYLLRTYLVRLYNSNKSNIELLKYLQNTENCLSLKYSNGSEENKISIGEKTNIYTFQAKERNAIRYFFHILGFDEEDSVYRDNEEIFKKRNNVAHLQYTNVTEDDFNIFANNILNALTKIVEKLTATTKQLIVNTIEEYNSKNPIIGIDDIKNIFENINKEFYLSEMDYYLINKKDGSIKSARTNSRLYFVKRYCLEILNLDF